MKVIHNPPITNWLFYFPTGSFLFLAKEKEYVVVEKPLENESWGYIAFVKTNGRKTERWLTDGEGKGGNGSQLFLPVVDDYTEEFLEEITV